MPAAAYCCDAEAPPVPTRPLGTSTPVLLRAILRGRDTATATGRVSRAAGSGSRTRRSNHLQQRQGPEAKADLGQRDSEWAGQQRGLGATEPGGRKSRGQKGTEASFTRTQGIVWKGKDRPRKSGHAPSPALSDSHSSLLHRRTRAGAGVASGFPLNSILSKQRPDLSLQPCAHLPGAPQGALPPFHIPPPPHGPR